MSVRTRAARGVLRASGSRPASRSCTCASCARAALDAGVQVEHARLGRLEGRRVAPRRRVVPPHLRRVVRRGGDQRPVRRPRRVGARPLPVPRRSLVDAIVDLPFALPTAVSGIALTAVYARTAGSGNGSARRDPGGIHTARRDDRAHLHRPAVRDPDGAAGAGGLDPDLEEAAAVLGASRWQTFRRVLLPAIVPAALTGFALSFARGLGEYGSVVFISATCRCAPRSRRSSS